MSNESKCCNPDFQVEIFIKRPPLTSGGQSHALRLDHCMCSGPQLCCRVFSGQTGPLNSGTRPLVQVHFEGKSKKSRPPSHLFHIHKRRRKVKTALKNIKFRVSNYSFYLIQPAFEPPLLWPVPGQ